MALGRGASAGGSWVRNSVSIEGGALDRIEHSRGRSEPGIAPGPDEGLRERLYRIVFANLPSGRVFVLDWDGRIIAAGGARSLTGSPVRGSVGRRARDLLDPAEYAQFEPALRAAMDGIAVHGEGQVRGLDLEYWLQPVRDDGGGVVLVVATAHDRHRAEEGGTRKCRRSGSSPGARRETPTATGRPTSRQACGRSAGAGTGSGAGPGTAVDGAARVARARPPRGPCRDPSRGDRGPGWADGAAGRGAPNPEARRILGLDRTRAKVVDRGPEGQPRRLAGTITDITQHRRASEERRAVLAASEARYRSLHESMMDGFVQVGMDGVIQEANEVYRQMLGYGPAELRKLSYTEVTPERWHAEETRIVRDQVLPRGFSDVYEKEYRRKDGSVFPVELRTFLLREKGRPAGMWAIVRDLTGRNEVREQLATTRRLAALGTIVAGVAHEINNPLAAAISSDGFAIGALEDMLGQLHSGRLPEPKALAGNLVEILEALRDAQASGLRIARIVKNMAAFARPEASRGRATLGEVAELAVRRLPTGTREWIRVHVEDAGPVEVAAPAALLAEVVVQLLNNAASATREAGKCDVTIRIGPAPGRGFLEVADHGVGMEPGVMARVFDPFFSTRRTGEGLGLGLSMAHSVVRSLGGTISVRSAPGEGSTFRVELPVAEPAVAEGTGGREQEA